MTTYNIYCDESCHLENDQQNVMVLGALWCPTDQARRISINIKRIKAKHGIKSSCEIKWTKVSPAKLDFYKELIRYFFEENELNFRALVVPDKLKLNHAQFNQDHNTWYYKMYFELLKTMLDPHSFYQIFIDIKDTHSGRKVKHLQDVLSNNCLDFERKIIKRIQNVRSEHVEQIQLADLLMGCVLGLNRNQPMSSAKMALAGKMQEQSKYKVKQSTILQERKVNIFRWTATETEDAKSQHNYATRSAGIDRV